MKKLLSSILVGTMLISSIGTVSVFADEPGNATTAIVETVERTEVQANNPQVESSAGKEVSKEIKPVKKSKPGKKSFFARAKEYVVETAKVVGKGISEVVPARVISSLCGVVAVVAVEVLCRKLKVRWDNDRKRRYELMMRRSGCPDNLEEMIKALPGKIRQDEIDSAQCTADVKSMKSTNPDLEKLDKLYRLSQWARNFDSECKVRSSVTPEDYNTFLHAMLERKPCIETNKKVEAFANECPQRDFCTVFGDIIDECKSWSDYVTYIYKQASCGSTELGSKNLLSEYCGVVSNYLKQLSQDAEISKICADITLQK